MGCNDSKFEEAVLTPTSPNLDLFSVAGMTFCYPTDTLWRMKEDLWGSWSGDDFEVQDVNGQVAFKVDAKVFNLRDAKFFRTTSGQDILEISKKLSALRATWHLYQGESRRVTLVKKIGSWKSLYRVFIYQEPYPTRDDDTELDHLTPEYEIMGDIIDKDYSVYKGVVDQGVMVAQVSKKWHDWGSLLGRDMYGVKVGAGVDVAFLLACVIIVDTYDLMQRLPTAGSRGTF